MNQPSYYRARLEAMADFASRRDDNLRLFSNGVVPELLKNEFDISINKYQVTKDNDTLHFTELTRFNNWFAMHPEKVCGTEKVTSSLQFPITIKGNITDAVAQIRKDMKTKASNMNLALAKAKAKALKLKLLLNTGNTLTGFKIKKTLIIK
jgi:hypothetical protein